jgi:hypothetical protein
MNKDLERAKAMGLVGIDRWSEGMDHHPMSERSMRYVYHEGTVDISIGGDGDDGEQIMFALDSFWESKPVLQLSPDVIASHLAVANVEVNANVVQAIKAIFNEAGFTLEC